MKKIIAKIKFWIVYKITYYEISYGNQTYWYKGYSQTERKAIAYNIAREYCNF
jgi:hypothetical protein